MDIESGRFVVFDLETTGLDVNRDFIIEIGAAKIENGEIGERFSSFVSYPAHLPEDIKELTGIADGDLKDAPPIEDVLVRFKNFARGCTLVAHNLGFDFAILRNWGFWCVTSTCDTDFDPFAEDAIDTLALSKKVLGGAVKNYKLHTLADYFGIPFEPHRALGDAVETAEVFLKHAARG